MGRPKQLPNVQASDFPTNEDQLKLTRARRDWVQRAFLHSWEGYKARELSALTLRVDPLTPMCLDLSELRRFRS